MQATSGVTVAEALGVVMTELVALRMKRTWEVEQQADGVVERHTSE